MKMLKEQFIEYVIEEEIRRAGEAGAPRVMDLGCGTAAYMPSILKKYPDLQYVGVEPIPASYEAAKKNLAGLSNATLHFKLGYDSIPDEAEASFDLVFSLSALEHIKELGRFIAMSAKYLKSGGTLMHRYDLGHALYPHTLKERLHVFLGNTVPGILPQRQFVRYVPESEVRALYEQNEVTPTKTTYHQMPNHKSLEKLLRDTSSTAIDELFAWEMKHQPEFAGLDTRQKEKLFPAVAVWGKKR
ncbi:class I SAM-dependent methyltransferase [Candidatus Nomurabacteria bacterium]|nr:class I SAM-dependent methyltransferase [Candidatus Nomurabacteria bacterium]